MDKGKEKLREFATRYTAAWCSGNPQSVAAFFSRDGSLTINGGEPSIGRTAIAAAAESFMTAFPDLQVAMDEVRIRDGRTEYHWTLTGTNTGPGGTGNRVRISGFENWTFAADSLIAQSIGTSTPTSMSANSNTEFDVPGSFAETVKSVRRATSRVGGLCGGTLTRSGARRAGATSSVSSLFPWMEKCERPPHEMSPAGRS